MIIDGKKIAASLNDELKNKILGLSKKPSLCVVIVGSDFASEIYIRNKKRACENVGIVFNLTRFNETVSEKDVLKNINDLNHNEEIDGIIVQMPLPKHIDPIKVIEAIDPNKDVDGFHPLNVGKMLIGDESGFLPCTPYGIKVLLEKSLIEVETKHVVIVGRSNIVGKPLAAILMQKKHNCNATVTIAHSFSKNLKDLTRSADILVAAIGKPHFITKELVSKKTVVIDVGMNHLKQKDGTTKLVGDVDFDEVSKIASYITPVPGGVGPMTVAMLLQNTFKSYHRRSLCRKI
ncbi:MAG: bifunctional methylenetetrahydrofolate dehydrogenase/methenyltetrahydrofolate cyclohydrolase FolD [Parachlamydiales bacterium]|jgi:methylenetetrahydrofolate dehydrogenase (NADP+)/methenyltetrahydrofolate cyclohydrolase